LIIHRAWQPPGEKSSFVPQQHGAAFRAWLAQPIGKHFLELECHKINTMITTLFGYVAVIIGEPNFDYCLQRSVIKHKFLLNEDLNLLSTEQSSLLHTRQDKLPLETASVDLVYLAHSLEFASNPHEVLREAYRILRPDGHLIITMFNPLSSWGAWRTLAKIGKGMPWVADFMSAPKLKDWLALLGFDIMRINYFGFNLPFGSCGAADKLSLCERLGQRLELPFGAAYLIEASKRVMPLTPVAQAWQAAKPDIVVDDVIEPTI
jgi:SAM-dependent methyltransferase